MSAATTGTKGGKPSKCPMCGRIFETSDQLELHKRMDHGSKSSPPAGVG